MVNKEKKEERTFFDPALLPMVYHPGETLEEKLQEMGMSVKEFATRVSKPEKTIIAVIKGKSGITPDMAVAFEMVTLIPAHMWLNHQKRFDEFVARKKREKIVRESRSWISKFPYQEILDLGWFSSLPATKEVKEKTDNLCQFFGVSSPQGWKDFYLNQRLQVAFRITLSEACDPYALSAWLRRGEIQASEMSLDTRYSAKLLRGILNNIVELKNSEGEINRELLTSLLGSAGVKLIFTETLSTAPVKGCSRYIYGFPSIQLAKEFASESDFWRTLFHEIGHILLHGKKDIFIENANFGNKNPEKEREAEEFAAKWMSK